MMENDVCKVAIKIDVDTLKGYREGLPRLLDILAERNLRASIFFSMGPDNSGKAVCRVFRKGFVSKMLRTRAPSVYGLKTLFYGTLLSAPMIATSAPDVLKRAVDEGHDCGIHAWDHVFWQDHLARLPRPIIREQFERALELFERITGTVPRACAAPGWQASPDSLAVQDELNFDYCSDARGRSPFLPSMGGATFRTPQIPTTLPTLDEVWGCQVRDAESAKDCYLDLLEPGLNVHTIHTEMEGGALSGVFVYLLDQCLEGELTFVTLREALEQTLAEGSLPIAELIPETVPGRAGTVAVQSGSAEL